MTYDYSDYQLLIFKLAYKWSSPTVHFQDLVSEGNEVFVTVTKKYNPAANTKFGTFLYTCLDNAMNDFVTKGIVFGERKIAQPQFEKTELAKLSNESINPERYVILKSWAESLSKESQFILQIVWETPMEIIECIREENYNCKNSMKYIRRHLKELGWKPSMIERCFLGIKKNLKNL